MSKCYECKYERADCKGNKQDDCQNFSKKGAVNYPQRIRELETELELNTALCEVFRGVVNFVKQENSKLKSENEKLKSECNKYWCHADCDNCENKCRAWQI